MPKVHHIENEDRRVYLKVSYFNFPGGRKRDYGNRFVQCTYKVHVNVLGNK